MQVPWEVLKTAAFGLGFQHLPRDLANVNVWKTMFDPYNDSFTERVGPYQIACTLCLNMPEDRFSHGAAHLMFINQMMDPYDNKFERPIG